MISLKLRIFWKQFIIRIFWKQFIINNEVKQIYNNTWVKEICLKTNNIIMSFLENGSERRINLGRLFAKII